MKQKAPSRPLILAAMFILLAAILVFAISCQNQQARPNVILCMADDLGWGDVGYNGNGVHPANMGHLKKEEINLAELFKENGYATGHFGKWHLGTLSPDYSGKGKRRQSDKNYMTPGMAGFEEWFSTEYAVATYDPCDKENSHKKVGDPQALYWENGVNISEGFSGCDSKIIMDRALPFIRKAAKKRKPFFTVIWFHSS